MDVIQTKIDLSGAAFAENRDHTESLVAELRGRLTDVQAGGGAAAREKHVGRGKLLVYDSLTKLQQSVDASCRVRVDGDITALCSLMRAKGSRIEHISTDQARVWGTEVGTAVLEASRECGVVVREITPSRNSLEDIYLEAVRATEGKALEPAAGGRV